MKHLTPILSLTVACAFSAPAFAGLMSMEDIKLRLQTQQVASKVEPASVRTDEEGNPLSNSGYMAMPYNARIMLDIQFKVGSAKVTKTGGKQIKALCDAMKDMDEMPSLHLIGHTDRSGRAEKNLEVSQNRAAAVRNYIDEHCGIPGGMILTSGEGEAFAPADGPANNADDRRIEVQIIGAPAPATAQDAETAEEDKETSS